MKVEIPTPLRSYTNQSSAVEATGSTVGEIFADLERQFPGIRFRMVDEQDHLRQHIRVYINTDVAHGLSSEIQPSDRLRIITAISGG